MKELSYTTHEEPLVIFKQTLELIMKSGKKWVDRLGLFCLYYYTAKWQGTNQVKCTNRYASKKLIWCLAKVIRTRKELEDLGFIRTIVKRDSTNAITGHYVRVLLRQQSERVAEAEEDPSPDEQGKAKVEEKRKVAIPEEYMKFSELWQLRHSKLHSRFYPASNKKDFSIFQMEKSALELQRLVKIDGWEFEEVKKVLLWALKDRFWGEMGNIRSLATVRTKGRNGETKFSNIRTQYLNSEKETNQTPSSSFINRLPKLSQRLKELGRKQQWIEECVKVLTKHIRSVELYYIDPNTKWKITPEQAEAQNMDVTCLKGPGSMYTRKTLCKAFDIWITNKLTDEWIFDTSPNIDTLESWFMSFLKNMKEQTGYTLYENKKKAS